jgi:hypothetical protein
VERDVGTGERTGSILYEGVRDLCWWNARGNIYIETLPTGRRAAFENPNPRVVFGQSTQAASRILTRETFSEVRTIQVVGCGVDEGGRGEWCGVEGLCDAERHNERGRCMMKKRSSV